MSCNDLVIIILFDGRMFAASWRSFAWPVICVELLVERVREAGVGGDNGAWIGPGSWTNNCLQFNNSASREAISRVKAFETCWSLVSRGQPSRLASLGAGGRATKAVRPKDDSRDACFLIRLTTTMRPSWIAGYGGSMTMMNVDEMMISSAQTLQPLAIESSGELEQQLTGHATWRFYILNCICATEVAKCEEARTSLERTRVRHSRSKRETRGLLLNREGGGGGKGRG